MGLDSVGVDPGLFPLLMIERIEVERWPGGLKVHLYTAQHRYLAPRSRIGITTGDDDISRFHGDLEYRWASGLGLTGIADYFDAPDPNRQGALTTIGSGLFRAQWVPRADRGFQVQLMTLSPDQGWWGDPGVPPAPMARGGDGVDPRSVDTDDDQDRRGRGPHRQALVGR
jgi:hypothetical protein